MLAVTYPYGTERIATVERVFESGSATGVVCIDDKREGYVMLGCRHDIRPEAGDRVILRFVNDGPLGGCWKIVSRAELVR